MIPDPKQNPPILTGKHVRLRPTEASDAAIYAAVTPISTFKYYATAMPLEQSEAGFRRFVDIIVDSPSVQGFTCELIATGEVVGGTTFMDIRLADEHVEVGMTWYVPQWRGTFVNPECKLLMLTHAFEVFGCTKVTLKCDNRNEHSKSAILKLGAKHEGILRRHRMTDVGEFRDTSYYSILKEEWPAVKTKLQERLREF